MALPANLVKATIFFDGIRHGWTESFWWISGVDDLNPNADSLQTICQKRVKLLGNQGGIQAYRVSFETDAAANPVLGDSVLRYAELPGGQGDGWDTDEPDAALLGVWRNTDSKKHKNQFLRGIPDAIDVQNGKFVTDLPGWQTSWNSWVGAMIGRASGWVTATKNKVVQVTGYTQEDNSTVTITVPAGTFGAGPYVIQKVRIAGVNGKSVLNGQQLVQPLSDTTCVTVKPIAVSPFLTPGKLTTYTYGFVAAANIYAQKIVTRRVGAPLLVSHGRRKARPRT